MNQEVNFYDAREMASEFGEVVAANEGLDGSVNVLVINEYDEEIVVTVSYVGGELKAEF